jgi:opine dehydrogenase
MPIAAGLLAIAGAVTGEDLHAGGRTLESLGLANLDRPGMAAFLAHGC